MATTDELTPRELVESGLCIGCAGDLGTLTGPWCRGCWQAIEADPFTIPDLLDGGRALRGG